MPVGVLLKLLADRWKAELSRILLRKLDGMNREKSCRGCRALSAFLFWDEKKNSLVICDTRGLNHIFPQSKPDKILTSLLGNSGMKTTHRSCPPSCQTGQVLVPHISLCVRLPWEGHASAWFIPQRVSGPHLSLSATALCPRHSPSFQFF